MTDLSISGIGDATLIASGGSALVYRAKTADGQDVAVKLLRGVRGTEIARRFEREQSAAERLQEHPHIIEIFGSGLTASGEPYLVLPLMEAGSLADELDRTGPFSLDRAVADVSQAAMAIDFAHRRGVLHRDLKPGNLLRTDDGSIVVTDFGIARVLDAGISSATIGAATPLYAAPELLADNEASLQSEVYALGALLYALLSGQPAFADSANIWATINRIREDPVLPIPGVPDPVMRVITQAMAKKPHDRPATAAQLQANLQAALSAGPEWHPPRPAATTLDVPSFDAPIAAATTGTSSTVANAPEPSSLGAGRSSRRALAGVAALVLLGGLTWFGVRAATGDEASVDATAQPTPVDTSLPPPTSPPSQTSDNETAEQVEPEDEPEDETDTDTGDSEPQPDPTPADRLVSFAGTHFNAYFPEGWSLVRSDIEVPYGYRSEFIADDMYLTVDTTPSEQRTGSATVESSAREIAASIRSASAVTTEEIDGLEIHWFTFRNNRGVDSVDIFFEVDGDGYAILAGSNSQPDAAFDIARKVALTIRSA